MSEPLPNRWTDGWKPEHHEIIKGQHLAHCFQGENAGCCKYGDLDCPATPERESIEQEMFTDGEVIEILRNVGVDPECGACMEVAFTGVTTNTHTCDQIGSGTDSSQAERAVERAGAQAQK